MQVDALHLLLWAKTKDGAKGRNAPKPLWKTMIGTKEDKESVDYESIEDFEKYWKQNGGG